MILLEKMTNKGDLEILQSFLLYLVLSPLEAKNVETGLGSAISINV